jgi:hypothetical protein
MDSLLKESRLWIPQLGLIFSLYVFQTLSDLSNLSFKFLLKMWQRNDGKFFADCLACPGNDTANLEYYWQILVPGAVLGS